MSERPINAQPAAPISHIEVSTPLWRLVSVIAACGAVAAFAYYLNAIHHADDVATVVVVTAGYTISFWARKRPDMMARRFGVFGRIATAIRNSQDNLRKWVRQATARRCTHRGKLRNRHRDRRHLVIIAMHALWGPWLAVAVGAAIGAVVAAPHMFADIARRIVVRPSDAG